MFGVRSNVAVTLLAASIVTVQVPVVLVQAPDQPVKVLPLLGVAVRVTLVPLLKLALPLLLVQLMVPVLGVTVPVPVPDLVRERVKVVGGTDDARRKPMLLLGLPGVP